MNARPLLVMLAVAGLFASCETAEAGKKGHNKGGHPVKHIQGAPTVEFAGKITGIDETKRVVTVKGETTGDDTKDAGAVREFQVAGACAIDGTRSGGGELKDLSRGDRVEIGFSSGLDQYTAHRITVVGSGGGKKQAGDGKKACHNGNK